MKTFADVALLSKDDMTPEQAERWCRVRHVTASEGWRIFYAANGEYMTAIRIRWQETWWKDDQQL